MQAHRADGRRSHCRACLAVYREAHASRLSIKHAEYYASRKHRMATTYMVKAAKRRANKTGVPFAITEDDVIIPEWCPVLGLRLEKGEGTSLPQSPSLDRIIPELGYVRGNVLVISHRANAIKQDATPDEIARVAAFYQQLLSPRFHSSHNGATPHGSRSMGAAPTGAVRHPRARGEK